MSGVVQAATAGATAAASSSSTSSPAVETAARFLVGVEKTWTICRLYGDAHPMFRQTSEATAAGVAGRFQVSVSPKGFSIDRAAVGDGVLLPLAQRLRRMGLVGLGVEPGVTA